MIIPVFRIRYSLFVIRYSLFVYSVFVIRYSCRKIFVIFGIRIFQLFSDLYKKLDIPKSNVSIGPQKHPKIFAKVRNALQICDTQQVANAFERI